MQINNVTLIGAKSLKQRYDKPTTENNTGTSAETTKPLSYYECVNFKGMPNSDYVKLIKNRFLNNRLLNEIGIDSAKIIEEYAQQIKEASPLFIDAVHNVLERKKFLKIFYNAISHPIATTDHTIEMRMVPKYLELAEINGNYRFSEKSVENITKYFDEYMTESDKTDIIKELLEIGKSNNNFLSEVEIINFLDTTTGLTKEGQNKVLIFIKHAKEVLHLEPKLLPSSSKEAYEEAFCDQIINYESVKKYLERQIPDITEHIKHENQMLVNMIASSENPKLVAEIIQKTGVNENLKVSLSFIERIEHIIPNKPQFLRLLTNSFYPKELISITKALEAKDQQHEIPKIIKKIEKADYDKYKYLEDVRERIIKDLNIEKEVTLIDLDSLPYVKVKRLTGNFEGGKRR